MIENTVLKNVHKTCEEYVTFLTKVTNYFYHQVKGLQALTIT